MANQWRLLLYDHFGTGQLTRKAPNTTLAEFENTVDPDETAQMSRLIWIYSVCPLDFDFSNAYSLYLKFFEILQM